MTLTRWNPTKELLGMEKEVSKLLNSFNNRFGFNSSKNDEELLVNITELLTYRIKLLKIRLTPNLLMERSVLQFQKQKKQNQNKLK